MLSRTTSTGGFSPYDASLGHFDSAHDRRCRDHSSCCRRRELRAALRDASAASTRNSTSATRSSAPTSGSVTLIIGITTVYLWRAATSTTHSSRCVSGTAGGLAADGHRLRHRRFRRLARRAAGAADARSRSSAAAPARPAAASRSSAGCSSSSRRWCELKRPGPSRAPRSRSRSSGKPVPPRVMNAVAGFFAVYLVVFGIMMMLLMTTGLDQVTRLVGRGDLPQQRRSGRSARSPLTSATFRTPPSGFAPSPC